MYTSTLNKGLKPPTPVIRAMVEYWLSRENRIKSVTNHLHDHFVYYKSHMKLWWTDSWTTQ
jgi:hypothetical protein